MEHVQDCLAQKEASTSQPLTSQTGAPGFVYLAQFDSHQADHEVHTETQSRVAHEICAFQTEEAANNFYGLLMKYRHRCLSPPMPVVPCSSGYLVIVAKRGQPVDEFLNDQKNKILLECLNIKTRTRRFSYKRLSTEYKMILRNLIEVQIHLKDTGLVCSLDFESVRVVSDFCVVTRLRTCDEGDKEKLDLADFIKSMNTKAKIHTFSTSEMNTLICHLGKSDIDESIFKIPFFWDSFHRCEFIVSLHDYLDCHRQVIFSTPDIIETFRNWKTRMEEYPDLILLMKQDAIDRKKYSNKKREESTKEKELSIEELEERKIRELLDFMRRSLHHFTRIKRDIRESFAITTKFELQMFYEHIFPNHIQLLATRVEELKINLQEE